MRQGGLDDLAGLVHPVAARQDADRARGDAVDAHQALRQAVGERLAFAIGAGEGVALGREQYRRFRAEIGLAASRSFGLRAFGPFLSAAWAARAANFAAGVAFEPRTSSGSVTALRDRSASHCSWATSSWGANASRCFFAGATAASSACEGLSGPRPGRRPCRPRGGR